MIDITSFNSKVWCGYQQPVMMQFLKLNNRSNKTPAAFFPMKSLCDLHPPWTVSVTQLTSVGSFSASTRHRYRPLCRRLTGVRWRSAEVRRESTGRPVSRARSRLSKLRNMPRWSQLWSANDLLLHPIAVTNTSERNMIGEIIFMGAK